MRRGIGWIALVLLLWGATAPAQPPPEGDTTVSTIPVPRPVSDLRAFDKDNDHGHAVVLEWKLSPDDGAGANVVMTYRIDWWVPFLLDSLRTVHQAIVRWHNLLVMSEEEDEERFVVETLPDGRQVGRRLSDDDLRRRIDSLRTLAEAMEARLPAAYAAYPGGGEWRRIKTPVAAGETRFEHSGTRNPGEEAYVPDGVDLYYRVMAVTADTTVFSEAVTVGPVQSKSQWYNTRRTVVLIGVLIFTFFTVTFVQLARKGSDLYVRPLAGIEAVDEAIGRATEMGRPILYVLGLGSAAEIATIASFTILGRVAKKVAEYQTHLLVPCYDPIVMSVAQEVVKSSFLDAGHPDAYNQDMVYFVTQSQFAYVAAVNGTMLRELPATNLYLGKFYAESLLLAETGALAGSIQIAGTDEIPQIPFFIVACDYTLIGEELFAASAYLGREPILLGSLKAQDYAKAIIVVYVILGVIGINLALASDSFSWMTALRDWIQAVQ